LALWRQCRGSMRYFGHDASAMSAKRRGSPPSCYQAAPWRRLKLPALAAASSPRAVPALRSAAIGSILVYAGTTAPANRAPVELRRPGHFPGSEYEEPRPRHPMSIKARPEPAPARLLLQR
jgi:hypothetical protein